MAERLIPALCFLLYAAPFLYLAIWQRESGTPISFWSGGEQTLKAQIQDCRGYNAEMARLYLRYGGMSAAAAVCCLLYPLAGFLVFGAVLTAGTFLVYRGYRRALAKYSRETP